MAKKSFDKPFQKAINKTKKSSKKNASLTFLERMLQVNEHVKKQALKKLKKERLPF